MSHPSPYACYAFNNGGCSKSQDECHFTHLTTSLSSHQLKATHPHLAAHDLRIAEAASQAGFDCSDWRKLHGLIKAVKYDVQNTRYPDRYSGTGRYKSSLYPDRWRPEAIRPRKAVSEVYQDTKKVSTLPVFAKPAEQILAELKNANRQHKSATGSNLDPLGDKRKADDYIDLTNSSPKRLKVEASSQVHGSSTKQTVLIDLTEEDLDATVTRGSHQRRGKQVANSAGSNNRRMPARRRQAFPPSVIQNDTTSVLAHCASKIHGAAHGIAVDRESLRERWEDDDGLKLQSVTDDLAELNREFHTLEGAISKAIKILEERLMQR